jgi:hypothetical protein
MTTSDLERQFARKPGLPYLLSTKPLRKTVARMISNHGYAYWDDDMGIAHWNAQTQEKNWDHARPLPDSPDVATTIKDNDVKIGGDYELFSSIEALLEQHSDEIQPPLATDCENCGSELPEDSSESLCEECRQPASCSECGNTVEDAIKANEPLKCDECAGPGSNSWENALEPMSAQRAFSEIRSQANSNHEAGSHPAVSSLIIDIEGDDPFQHGTFLAQRSPMKSRSDNVKVDLSYKSRGDLGNGDANFRADFNGPLAAFNTLDDSPEGFSDRAGGEKRIDLKFHWEAEEPEAISDAEDDILAELGDELAGTNVTVRLKAKGPIDLEEVEK